MATMEEDVTADSRSIDPLSAARPDWSRQPHTWFLVGLAAANVAFDGLAGHAIDGGSSSAAAIMIGVLLAQLFLMGLWMALGGLHVAQRFAAVTITTMAGAVAFALGLRRDNPELGELAAFSGVIVLATHAVLLPLRALVGYRIDFDPAYHARSTDKSMQLRLIHLNAFTTACALPFAVLQAIDESDTASALVAFGGAGLLASLPVAWIAVAARRTLRFWLAAIGLLLASFVVDLWALGNLGGPNSADAPLVYFSIAATVLANLGILRLFYGLRLFSILGPAPGAGAANGRAPLDGDLAYLIDAWPRLPEELRSDLLQQARSAVAPALQQELLESPAESAGRV